MPATRLSSAIGKFLAASTHTFCAFSLSLVFFPPCSSMRDANFPPSRSVFLHFAFGWPFIRHAWPLVRAPPPPPPSPSPPPCLRPTWAMDVKRVFIQSWKRRSDKLGQLVATDWRPWRFRAYITIQLDSVGQDNTNATQCSTGHKCLAVPSARNNMTLWLPTFPVFPLIQEMSTDGSCRPLAPMARRFLHDTQPRPARCGAHSCSSTRRGTPWQTVCPLG